MNPELARLLAEHGAIRRADHPALTNAIRHALDTEQAVPLLRGTYALERTNETLVSALRLWDPDVVLTGAMAARLTWWPELDVTTVTATSRRRSTRDVPGLILTRGRVPDDLVYEPEDLDGLRVAHPSWTVLDMVESQGGKAIDEVLRRRATTLKALWWALETFPRRRGDRRRRELLLESRAEPWSALEREAHGLLYEGGITGWTTNERLVLPSGEVRFLDISFNEDRFGIELDGEEYHRTPEAFHADRAKDMWAARLGWRIVRLTWATLDELLPTIRECLGRGSADRNFITRPST